MANDPQPASANVIPIGKYKGRTVEEILVADPNYLEWLSAQPWFRAQYVAIHQTIINRGAENQETPEHNSIQVKFLNDDFCVRCWLVTDPSGKEKVRDVLDDIRKENLNLAAAALKYINENEYKLEQEEKPTITEIAAKLSVPIKEATFGIYDRTFEHRGVDVHFKIFARSALHDNKLIVDQYRPPSHLRWYPTRDIGWKKELSIEIKPTIGDDYPAVLRQMRRTNSNTLVVGSYTGQGATQEQFVATMESAGIKVVFLADV